LAIKVRDQDTFIQMDAADEQQILKEMEGEIVKDLYYDVNGKKGLSYVGVNHMSFKIGGIKIIPESVKVEYDADTEEYVASVVACNEKYALTRAGMSVQPKMMDVYDKDSSGRRLDTMHKEYDRFARIKALSKAQRNAIKAVMPEALIAAYLDYFIKLKQGARIQTQPRDDGPIGMKDPRKVDANYTVKDSENPPLSNNMTDAEVTGEQDIIDHLEAAGLDANGVEIVTRDFGKFIITPIWPKPLKKEDDPWQKYHVSLRGFNAVYHGKDDPSEELRGKWTIGV
jgi:hypothetical protein